MDLILDSSSDEDGGEIVLNNEGEDIGFMVNNGEEREAGVLPPQNNRRNNPPHLNYPAAAAAAANHLEGGGIVYGFPPGVAAAGSLPLNLNWMDLSGYMGQIDSRLVALSSLPGCKFRHYRRDLNSDLTTLKAQGIHHILCLLTDWELRKYRVPCLLKEYNDAGFSYTHYPIPDAMIPEDISEFMGIIWELIHVHIQQGNRVLIHCYGGLGRTGLIGACLLLSLDDKLHPDEAISQIRNIRGPRAVQSVKQYNFIHEFRDLRALDEDRSVSR